MDLELEAQEKNIGPFYADLVCRNADGGALVLIENQLEATDHKHLGQVVTYAAGLDSEKVCSVWIAKRFVNEHRAAMCWLNQVTGSNFNFFALEIEAWRIDGSQPAPKFNIASQPSPQEAKEAFAHNRWRGLYNQYWSAFQQHLEAVNSPLIQPRAMTDGWFKVDIGRANFSLYASISVPAGWGRVEIYIHNDPECIMFDALFADRSSIEETIGGELDWDRRPEQPTGRIKLKNPDIDPKNEEGWPSQFDWLEKTLQLFDKAFRDRIRNLG
ncbi:MAG: DUF4268 domain-containing protein [Rhodospirillales bacterium]